MSISESDVEKLLVSLILDKKIDASIDQINKIVYIQSRSVECLLKEKKKRSQL